MTTYSSTHKLSQFEWTAVGIAVIAVLAAVYLSGCATGFPATYTAIDIQEEGALLASERLPDVSQIAQQACRDKNKGNESAAKACMDKVRATADKAVPILRAAHDKNVTARQMVQAAQASGGNVKSAAFWIGEAAQAYLAAQQIMAELGYTLGGP